MNRTSLVYLSHRICINVDYSLVESSYDTGLIATVGQHNNLQLLVNWVTEAEVLNY